MVPGLDEGAFLFRENDPKTMAKYFYNHGASVVVLKLGADGAYYLSENENGFVPGFQGKRVVDPVGAGDGFAAWFFVWR